MKKSLPEKNSPAFETIFRYEIQTSDDSCTILGHGRQLWVSKYVKESCQILHVFVLVFELSNLMQTFEEIIMLRQLIIEEKGREHAHAPIIVIGNKNKTKHGVNIAPYPFPPFKGKCQSYHCNLLITYLTRFCKLSIWYYLLYFTTYLFSFVINFENHMFSFVCTWIS